MRLPLNPRSIGAFVHDVAAAALAWWGAFLLRFNFDIPGFFVARMLDNMAWVVALQALLFLFFGLYRGMWRYASVRDLQRIVMVAGLSGLLVALVVLLLLIPSIPRSVLLFDPVLLALFMGGSRIAYRAWKEQALALLASGPVTPVIVLGAGDAAADLMKNLGRTARWRVAGLLDDDSRKHGRQIHGVSVLGPLDSVAIHAPRLEVHHAVIAMPGVSHNARRRALELCADAGLEVMTVPSYEDIVSGRVTISQLRHVELDDLLGRDPVELDDAGLREWLHGRTVAVTGAGGSIGAELCRQVARFQPARLVMIELSEFALYRIREEFEQDHPDLEAIAVIADVKNGERLEQVFSRWPPAVVLHAAAYKHVPLMEERNAWEAVHNNVAGTLATARAAAAAGAAKFVLVSTDKAVNPTNVMGASKRLAERVCQALSGSATRFVTVRFGNVLGSAGSVVPKFREQIARGGPLTVTHPDIERYFMTIPEASQLVLQAGLMGEGGEIFVLDMGEPVKIVDLARDLVRLSGLREQDIRIDFTGLRPGEKLFEEPLADNEHTLPTPHPKLRIARSTGGLESGALREVERWLDGAPREDEAVRSFLAVWVPEYGQRPMSDRASGGV